MLPKRVQQIVNQKEKYIQAQRDIFEGNVIRLQEQLLDELIKKLIPELDIENGKILNTKRNMNIIHQLDKLYTEFAKVNQTNMVRDYAESFSKIDAFNVQYFGQVALDQTTQKRFDAVMNKTQLFMNSRIGIVDGELIRGGYLESFISDQALLNEIRQLTMRAVTGGLEGKSFVEQLSEMITGNEQKGGGFEKYYRTYAYDSLQEYDRAYGNTLAQEFKMNYAQYQGGLIEDSRNFCREHDGNVYSREEIEKFDQWEDPETGEVPGYISSFPGYDPFVHCGGFNCRHTLSWISDAMAFRLRPELKNKL